jgi:ribokinase
MARITVVGSANVDHVVGVRSIPSPGETVLGGGLVRHPGGKGANQAVAAALQGAEVDLLVAVGDDDECRYLTDRIGAAGVDVSRLQVVSDRPTGTALITVSDDGENAIVVSPGANAELQVAELRGDIVSVSCEISTDAVRQALEAGRAAGAMTVLNPSPMPDEPTALMPLVDLVVLNHHEVEQLVGVSVADVDALVARLGETGCRAAVITRGSRGSLVLEDLDGPAPRVSVVDAFAVTAVDTTGCGDAFTGAMVASLAAGASLVVACQDASAVAAIAATRPGAQSSYPTADEVESFRAQSAARRSA